MSDDRATTGRLVQKWFGPVVPDSMLGQALSFVDEAASLRGQVETLQAELALANEKYDRLRVDRQAYVTKLLTERDQAEVALARMTSRHPSCVQYQDAETVAAALVQRDRARDIAAHLEAAVRELHKPFGGGGDRNGRCTNDGFLWPCSTIRHLEAELAKEGEPNG